MKLSKLLEIMEILNNITVPRTIYYSPTVFDKYSPDKIFGLLVFRFNLRHCSVDNQR